MNRQIHILVIFACLSWCLVAFEQTITPTPTPTPSAMRTLFDDDTCTPPCWFGLTSGVSTFDDLQALMETSEEIFLWRFDEQHSIVDEETGTSIRGVYEFHWRVGDGQVHPDSGGVIIRDETVYQIVVRMNEYGRLTLARVLEVMGNPDIVHVYEAYYSALPTMDLVYLDEYMRVEFSAENDCFIASMGEDYWARAVRYYSAEAANEPVYTEAGEQPQPAVAAYASAFTAYVPQETWDSWLEGDITDSCLGVLRGLPRATQLPTVMPTPILTPTPTNP